MQGRMVDLQRERAASGERNFTERSTARIFLRQCKSTNQLRRERVYKAIFFQKNRPIHFHINRTKVIRPVEQSKVNQNKSSFASTEINKGYPVVSCRSDSSSEANTCWCHKSNTWSHLKYYMLRVRNNSNMGSQILNMFLIIQTTNLMV